MALPSKISKIISIGITLLLLLSCSQKKSRQSYKIFPDGFTWKKVAEDLEFPEGPVRDGKGNIFFSNCNGGWVAKYGNSGLDTFVTANEKTLQKTNGLAIFNDHIFACEYGIGQILKISKAGIIEKYATHYQDKNFNRPNDLAFDEKGNLYFTDPNSYGAAKLDGRLFCIRNKDKKVVLVDDSLAFPNGIAFTENYKELYVCESARNRIIKYKVENPAQLTQKEIFAELPSGDPDGVAVDQKGNLYVAHFGSGTLYVISPQGKIVDKVATPGAKPTNLAFAGRDLQTLYLTEVETNSLYKTRVGISGVSLLIK